MTTNKQLRELAEKATPGPWWIDSHGHRMSAGGGSETVFIASEKMGEAKRHPETGNLSHWPNDWDASFIAAANPATILALMDSYEALQAECEKLRKQLESVKELLKDPVTVFVHMKHGIIAKPSLRDLIDLHGDVPNGEDVQLMEITKHRSESERLRKLVEECADYLDHNEHTCIHNGSALHRKLAEAIDAAMQGDQP